MIDAAHFVYEQNKNQQYSSKIEIVFQVFNPTDKKEVDRKLVEIEILKNNFPETKNNNYYEGEISFLIDKNKYLLNTKLVDSKSMNFWIKKNEVDRGASKYFSKLNLFYNNNGKTEKIENDFFGEIDNFSCSFYYFNENKSIDKLSLYLLSRNDTLYQNDIPIKSNQNNYDIPVYLDSGLSGSVICRVSDGDISRDSAFSVINGLIGQDFWLNKVELIKTVMRYVLPYKEYKKIKKMEDSEMIFYLKNYWNSLDPNPNSSENELLVELSARIKRVNSRFQESKTDGWNTDRGKTYIINGEPISIRAEINPQTNNMREIWNYQSGRIYVFEQNSFGRYYMINDGF